MLRTLCTAVVLSPAVVLAQLPVPASSSIPSLVRLVVTQQDDQPRTASGFVVAGGFILTTFGCVERATAVQVLPAAGDPRPATGIAAYDQDSNIVLLAVEWAGDPPAALKVAPESPAKDAQLGICKPGGPEAAPVATITEPPTWRACTFTTSASIDPTWGGAPLMKDGLVLGAVTGFHSKVLGAGFDPDADPPPIRVELPPNEPLFDAARPELIRALKPGAVIPWDRWPDQQKNITAAISLAQKATVSGRKRDTAAGLEAAREAVRLDERSWRAWRILSRLVEDDEESIEAAQRAIDLRPTDDYAYTIKAMALARQGQTDEAVAVARQAVAIKPRYYANYGTLGYVLQYAGDLEGAIGAYEEALKLNPRDDYCKNELARLREYLGQPADPKSPRPRF